MKMRHDRVVDGEEARKSGELDRVAIFINTMGTITKDQTHLILRCPDVLGCIST
jgi:hypothetical protein